MAKEVNVFEIAELLEAYDGWETLEDWSKGITKLTNTIKLHKYVDGFTVLKYLTRLTDSIRSELLASSPETQSFLDEENDINKRSFTLLSLAEDLKISASFAFELTWPVQMLDKMINYMSESDKPCQKTLGNSAGGGSSKLPKSGSLWSEFDVNKTMADLCNESQSHVNENPEGIPQNIVLQTSSHVNTLTSSNGLKPYTVQIKIYPTQDILGRDKSEWWRNAATTMQFTMGVEDTEYRTLAELTKQAMCRLQLSDNFKADKKPRFKNMRYNAY